ncbi:hypothetical protein [Bradyrhizobium sp. CER78]|uniref:hypothetical protein n=1 Tax=Bradyrhizobium sp. CER78 TaxID=3039162 RepID=UPI002448E2ED|nr:hypothetical protein [Bradyrhizobium sp. CER78]MDH2384823.1 hypothetical protein [Bradyrhizobium sp. CER78]
MTEEFLPTVLYTTMVDRLIPVAGQCDVGLIHRAAGPLLGDRPALAERLAALDPCPVTGKMTSDQVKIALGEHGDIWPTSIWAQVMLADLEQMA